MLNNNLDKQIHYLLNAIEHDDKLSSLAEMMLDNAVWGGMSLHDAALLTVGYLWSELRNKWAVCTCASQPNDCVLHHYQLCAQLWQQLAVSLETLYREVFAYDCEAVA